MTASAVWDEESWAGLPQLTDDRRADLCVIGLGGSGLAAVAEGRRLGARVIGLDAASVGSGAAGRNGGLLLAGLAEFHHRVIERVGRDAASAAYRLTLAEIDSLVASGRDVRRTGSLRVAGSAGEEADCAAHLAALQADQFPADAYRGVEGTGLVIPTDGVCQPLRLCRSAARDLLRTGAELFEFSPAVTIAGDRVTTPVGSVRCERVVVAVDGTLEQVLPELSSRVRTARLQMLATAPAPEVSFPRPVYSRFGYDYWQQLPDGRLVLGGLRDQFADSEWSQPPRASEPVQAALDRLLRERLAVRAPVTHRWAGVVAFTADCLPVIEEVRANVVAAGGYSGTGNVVGRLAGRAAAELALTGASPTAAALTPTRA